MKNTLKSQQYKIFLVLLKAIPTIMLIFHLLYILLSFFDIKIVIFRWIADMSFLTFIAFSVLIKIFKFCFMQEIIIFYNTFIYFLHDKNLIISNFLFLLGSILLVWSCLRCFKYKK